MVRRGSEKNRRSDASLAGIRVSCKELRTKGRQRFSGPFHVEDISEMMKISLDLARALMLVERFPVQRTQERHLTHPDPVMLPAGSIEKLRRHAGYTRWSVDGQFHLSHKQIGRAPRRMQG
jgi:hypothetical protein